MRGLIALAPRAAHAVAAEDPADLRAFATRLPLSAAVEAVVADGLFGARIPRPVPPAVDAEDALGRIEEIAELLVERGLVRPAEPVDIPRPPRLPQGASLDLLAIDVDPVLRAWLTAMVAAAQQPPASARPREVEERYGT